MNVDFFLAFLNSLNMGDVLNDVGYQMRPFEIEEGATDRAMTQAMEDLKEVLRTHRNQRLDGRMGAFLKSLPAVGGMAENAGKFADALLGTEYTRSPGWRTTCARCASTAPG